MILDQFYGTLSCTAFCFLIKKQNNFKYLTNGPSSLKCDFESKVNMHVGDMFLNDRHISHVNIVGRAFASKDMAMSCTGNMFA